MNAIIIHTDDNVAVALTDIRAGESVAAGKYEVTAKADVAQGHKIALRDIPQGRKVIKYGYSIGFASLDIAAGEHVHSHNLKTGLSGALSYTYEPCLTPPEPRDSGSFLGFRREDGKVGIRNEIWIIPTVGCVNSVGNILAQKAGVLAQGSIDGVYCFSHPYGCSQLKDDLDNTKKALAGLIRHPNAGAVLVLGLGCENNSIAGMKEMLGHGDTKRVKFLVSQDVEDEESASLALLEQLAAYAGGFKREEIPMSELVVGLKCGGSDGFSGITANPLTGAFSDRHIAGGGSAILTEVPEMFGAETILMNSCANREIFQKTVGMINGFKEYFLSHGQPVYENPSPGNKAGGITTLEEKSLGCTQKAGHAVVADVLGYGQPVSTKGLLLLDGPGNDLVASTALAVSGAHMVIFTTGRGTPFGSPVPTIKISTNSRLAVHKGNWIDFDAGGILFGQEMDALCGDLYEYIRKVASGEILTKTEKRGIRDFAIFKNGVTM